LLATVQCSCLATVAAFFARSLLRLLLALHKYGLAAKSAKKTTKQLRYSIDRSRQRQSVRESATTAGCITSMSGLSDDGSVDVSAVTLFFVRKGTDMADPLVDGFYASGNRPVEGLKERATRRGAHVLDRLDVRAPPDDDDDRDTDEDGQQNHQRKRRKNHPTHLVVSNHPLPPYEIAKSLGFTAQDDDGSGAETAAAAASSRTSTSGKKRVREDEDRTGGGSTARDGDGGGGSSSSTAAIGSAGGTGKGEPQSDEDKVVRAFQLYLGRHNVKVVCRRWVGRGHKRRYPPFNVDEPLSHRDEYLGVLPIKPASAGAGRKKSRTGADGDSSLLAGDGSADHNEELADLLYRVGKLYQTAPVDDHDPWRAYTFHMASGKLRRMQEITTDSDVDRLRQQPGIGNAVLECVEQYMQNEGTTIGRILYMVNDDRRNALREMMKIWGVGRRKGLKLVDEHECRNIDDVRRKVASGELRFDRNQLIGIEIYEDLQEEMQRSEVETILELVRKVVHQRLGDDRAELRLMGSYRRGIKDTCGDADILITHPSYQDAVHPELLGQVVDDLCTCGHIAYHLNYVHGMKPERFETLPQEAKNSMTNPDLYGRMHEKKGTKTNVQSYMGVFFSPVKKGRRRRIDIKFYPYRERIFASLYFTGNGHFNRSMRLWATRKFGWSLNDHGLFLEGTRTRVTAKADSGATVVFQPSTERDVFDKLELIYKEPNERDGFAAVQPKKGVFDGHMSKQEFFREEGAHSWVD